MRTFLRDLRYGLRVLARAPGFTAVALVTLMLGIGATVAIFSVTDAVLLRALPFRDRTGLVSVFEDASEAGFPRNTPALGNCAASRTQTQLLWHRRYDPWAIAILPALQESLKAEPG